MPGQRIPDLTAVTGANTANNDSLLIFDADANTTKRILRSQLAVGLTGDLPLQYYLGVLNSNPATRLDGSSLQIGDYYLDSVTKYTTVYNGSGWSSYASVIAAQTAAEAAQTAAELAETNAEAAEIAAQLAETNALASANAAAASYDSFDDRYLGSKASDPSLDNDGNALLTGALYWNSASSVMRVYTGSLWEDVAGLEQLFSGTYGAIGGLRNKVINGNFLVWQRATSQTSVGYGSDDRWYNNHSGSSKTHSQQLFAIGQSAVPGNPSAFSRTVVTSVAGAGNYVVKQHRFEGVRQLNGMTATLSFWAKADASRPIAIDFQQMFGTGGSPSPAITGIGVQKFSLTTTWQKFTKTVSIPSITGKTLGSNNDDFLELTFWFDAGSTYNSRTNSLGQQSGTFDIAQVQVEISTVATPFDDRSYTMELELCQRYYEVDQFGYNGAYQLIGSGNVFYVPFKTRKRITPTIATSGVTALNVTAPTVEPNSPTSYRYGGIATATGTTVYYGTFAADAEV